MKDPLHHDVIDALGAAYEMMFERAVQGFRKAEKQGPNLMHKFIDAARETAVELGEVSRDDAEKLALYLKRDLKDASRYLSETGRDWEEWFGFETTLLEAGFLELLSEAADPTTLELLKLKQDAEVASIYRTGEITGPGALVCDKCGEKLHFHKAGKIPPCPKCHATIFHRQNA